jgi:hypothetical protein
MFPKMDNLVIDDLIADIVNRGAMNDEFVQSDLGAYR